MIPSSTETAIANGDTRTLFLYHSHTGESIQATFRVNGSYDPAVLEKLNYFLRDWRNNDVTRMDPRLFDVVWEVYRSAGASSQPIVIISAYRSPQTNAMLRRRSRGVAEHSQHILGRAMDTTMPGMSMEKIREIGMRLQRGGVGWYPSSNFVHLDVGGVRSWPRMSYDQLVRLFPDGKTVHLAADGRALPRYAEARAEIASRGGVMSDVQVAGGAPFGKLFAWLFNKHDADEEADAAQQQPSRGGRGRQGNIELAGLRTNGASPSGAVPSAANNAANERTHVADLGANPDQRQGGESAEPPLKEKLNMRAGAIKAGPIPPRRPAELDEDVAVAVANVPLPPARPGFSNAIAFADVPAPPARPASLTHFAALADGKAEARESKDAVGATSEPATADSEIPLARAASLPVVITQGPERRESVPKQVLAFASETPVQDPRIAAPSKTPGDIAKPLAQSVVVPTRLDRAKVRPAGNMISAAFPAQSLLGQSLTGLRQAARIIPNVLSNTPSANYVASFGATASDLDSSHFTGPAAKSLALAQGFVRITEGSGPRHN